jgi:hypothetical protein
MTELVKSVEFLEVDTTGTEVSYDLTMGQDYSNCVPFLSCYGGTDNYNDKTWDCYFSGTTESGIINFRRYDGRSATGYIKCYVVEFDPAEVYVEQGTFDVGGGTHNVTTSSGFDVSSTALVHYWRSSDVNNYAARNLCRGRVTGDGSLEFYRNITGYSLNGHWFIFEAKSGQFTVEHKTSSVSAAGNTVSLSKAYDPLKTFLIGSFAGGNTSNADIDRSLCRLFIYHRGDVRWDKSYGAYTSYVAFQIIEFQDNKVHVPQCYMITLNSTESTWNWNRDDRMNFPTTSGFSTVIKTAPYFDRGVGTGTAYLDGAVSSVKLDNEYQVSFKKNSQAGDTYPSFSVVDWKGIEVDTGSNSSPLDPEETFVKSVQNSRILVEEWQGAVPLTKGQNIDNCVIFASQYCTGDRRYFFSQMHDVFFSDTGMVCARRIDGTNEGVVDVSVVEFYPDQVRVQSGSFNYGSMTSEANITLDRAIDTSKTFLLTKWCVSTGTNYASYHNMRCRIIDSKYFGVLSKRIFWSQTSFLVHC